MRLAAAQEGQAILGVSAARWHQLTQEPGFPEPVARLAVGAIYDADALEMLAVARRASKATSKAKTARPAKEQGSDRTPVPALPAGLTLP